MRDGFDKLSTAYLFPEPVERNNHKKIKMMNEKKIKELFKAHKADIPDDGFSERIIRRLPERRSILPQIIMSGFIMIGLILTFIVPGFTTLISEQISSLITSIHHLQMPSASSITVYFGVLALLGTIGYSVARVDI